jgi:hypothetical protein
MEAFMTLEQQLVQLEKGFWNEGGDYYREHVDAECLLAFREMVGVHSNEEIAGMNPGANTWNNVVLNQKALAQPAPDFALLTYEVDAQRKTGEPYKALVSTGYVRRGDKWKMAFHQQTPLDAEAH